MAEVADNNLCANPASEDLSIRLKIFRKWLSDDAGVFIHPALAIVYGSVNDSTKNAPLVLINQFDVYCKIYSFFASSCVLLMKGY